MKSALIIGLGRFGRHLSRELMDLDAEVMIVDRSETAVAALMHDVTRALVADCTDEAALRSLGVQHFDLCFVCIGSDFAGSLLITTLLKELGAARVIAKAGRDIHARLLLRNGADEVVYPERDSARRMASRLQAGDVFDYISLTEEYAIYELPTPRGWIGRSIREIGVRARYHINILAVKQGEALMPMPGAEYMFSGQEHILALAGRDAASGFLKGK